MFQGAAGGGNTSGRGWASVQQVMVGRERSWYPSQIGTLAGNFSAVLFTDFSHSFSPGGTVRSLPISWHFFPQFLRESYIGLVENKASFGFRDETSKYPGYARAQWPLLHGGHI